MYFATSFAFLAAALPQGNGKPQQVRHADTIPADALAVVSTAAWDDHRQVMTATGLDQVLTEPGGILSRLRRAALVRIVGSGAEELPELEDLGTLGFTLAVMPRADGDAPDVLAVVDLSEADANALRAALNRRAKAAEEVQRLDLAGTSAFTLLNVPGQPALAVVEDVLLVTSTTDSLAAAIARARGRAQDSLATTERFRTFVAQLDTPGGSAPWLAAYVDVESIWKWGLSQMPRPERDQVAGWIDHVGIGAIGAIGVTVGGSEGQILEHVVMTAPAPLPPLLAALFPSDPLRTDDLAALIATDATTFGVGQVRWSDAYRAILDILEKGEPALAAQARQMIEMLGGQMGGIDLERDFIRPLGARIVSMGWPAQPGETQDDLFLLELTQPDRVKSALGRMQLFDESPVGDFAMYLPKAGGAGALAIGSGQLVFASSERRLRRWISERRTGTTNPLLSQALRDLPEGSTGVGVVDLRRAATEALAGLDSAGPMLPPEADIARQLVSDMSRGMGSVRYSTRTDARGTTFVASSATGSVARVLAALASVMSDALEAEPVLASMLDQAQTADRSQDARKLVVLDAVRTAQDRFRAAHGRFAGLDELIEQSALRPDYFEKRVGDDTYALADSLVTVLKGAEGDKPHFAAVMWPKDRRAGEVLACSDDRAPQRNELLARVSGLDHPETTDLFENGAWGGAWTAGWRPVGPVAAQTTQRGAGAGGSNSATFQVLTALERQGEAGARELVGYLDHESTLIVARAAWSLGRLKHKPAVPKLIELLENHQDADVRRHAMGALAAMADPRTAQASVRALADTDATVRTLAAQNVGRLKFDGAKDDLVAVLTAPDEAVEDDVDAVTALLALRDFGDAKQLLPAATAFDREGRKAQEALAWVFQELSQELGPDDESMVLMAVLDHSNPLLRRFAIQRLGELREPKTASALESRLTQETDELRPLLEVSLAAVRGASADGDGGDATTLAARGRKLVEQAKAVWADPEQRKLVLAGAGGVVLFFFLISIALRRRRRRRQAETWAERTRPSEGFEDGNEVYDEYEDYGDEAPAEEWDETYEGEEAEWQTDGTARS